MSVRAEPTVIRATRTPRDFAFRLAYFVVAPIAIVSLARLYPVIGVIVNVGVALVVFIFAEAVRSLVVRYPLLARVLGGALRFEAYYRAHTPRPFLYYVLYPLLFPYWLSNAIARREFVLFRNLGGVGLVILVGTSAWDYYAHWQPELGFGPFLRTWVVVFLVQSVVTMMFVMPLATSVVTLELAGQRKRLAALLAVATLVVAVSASYWAKRRHEYVQLPTSQRMMLRTQANPRRAREVRATALVAAFRDYVLRHQGEAVKEGRTGNEILGRPIEAAREVLQTYYQPDEVMAFHLVAIKAPQGPIVVLYGVPPTSKKDPVWIGMKKDGKTMVTSVDELPKDSFALMRRAASH